jgi:hypothetical protein
MMLAWLRSMADAILGRVPGKPDRRDTATRMAMDGDFSDHGEPSRQKGDPQADDVDPLEELHRLTRDASRELRPERQADGCFSFLAARSPAGFASA